MRSPKNIVRLLTVLCVIGVSTIAQAQSGDVDTPFPSNLFEPAPGAHNFPSTESPELGDDMKPSVGLFASYQYRTMAVMACSGTTCGDDVSTSQTTGTIDLVKNALVSDILFSFNFLKRFQVGLAVPLYIWQNGRHSEIESNAQTGEQWLTAADDPYNSYGVFGDIRIHLKGRILGRENSDGFALGASVITALPMSAWTGQGEGYTGATNISVTAPNIIAGVRFKSFRAAANLGFLWREKEQFYSAVIGHSMKYAIAAGYVFNIRPEMFGIELFAEVYGNKSFVSEDFADLDSAPLMFNGGARFNIQDFAITLGAGGGIISAPGVPQVQGIFGFAWNPKKPKADPNSMITEWDLDGDGLENTVDECPQEMEDFDNFQDEDGCADNDNDKDTIQDGYDSCPSEPEDKDGFRDDDGCPDMDHDEDGIKEPGDKCPGEVEDYDGFEDTDGCPESDNDKDGILDAQDGCLLMAEDMDGFEDTDGCPEFDDDNDGVPDTMDKCPKENEILNGVKDDDGCPDKGDVLVKVTDESFVQVAKVEFKGKTTTISEDVSFKVLDIIAFVIANNSALRLSVASHTDARGTAEENLALTKARSEEIKAYLVKHGVPADRVETIGYGAEQPLESNKKTAGRKANNRVDFRIIRPVKKVVVTEDAAAGSDETMDFTADEGKGGGEGETMDFSIQEEKTEEMEMDFTEE